jgi:hypothetical protein
MTTKSKFFETLAVAVAGGESVKSASGSVGCSLNTAYHLSSMIEFKVRVSEIRTELTLRAIGKLTNAATQAADTLVSLLGLENEPSIRMNAAKAIFANLGPLSELGEIRQRIDALEKSQLRIRA